MLEVSREEITEGSLVRALVVLAAPLVVQNLVQVVQQVVDTFWVGRIGEAAVAAVGLNFPIQSLVFSVLMTPFVATNVLVSQRAGADDVTAARRAAVHGLVLAALLGVAVGGVVGLAAGGIVGAFDPGPAVAPLAVTYLATVMVGVPFVGLSDTLEAGFVGWGDSRAALYVNVTAVVVNVGLDPFLIFGYGPFPALGIQGAALATVLGYAAGFLLAAAMALGLRDSFRLTLDAVDLRVEEFRELVDVGAPATGQRVASDGARLVIVAVVSLVGGAAGLAAYTIGARVASVAYIPAQGLQQAAQSIVGQNLGAGNPGRARRTTWVGAAIAAVGLTVIGVAQWVFPAGLTTLFVPDVTPDALELTVAYLRILVYGYWALGTTYLFTAGFNGARRTRTSLVVRLLQYWAVRFPLAVGGALFLGFGVEAVFWAVTVSNVVAAVGVGAYYWHATRDGMLDRAVEAVAAD